MKVEIPDVMGFKKHPATPGVYVSGYITNCQQIRTNCFQINCLPLDLLYGMLIIAIAEFRERLGANEGQIYVHHSRDLSCFSYVDGCAATFKLSHNMGLNRSMIRSSSLRKLVMHATRPQYTVSATSRCPDYLNMSILMSHFPGIMYCIWIWIFKLWHS